MYCFYKIIVIGILIAVNIHKYVIEKCINYQGLSSDTINETKGIQNTNFHLDKRGGRRYMTYDFNAAALYDDWDMNNTLSFSLKINTLELFFELETGRMIGIEGYFPLVNAVRCNIDIPKWDENQYILPNIDLLNVEKGAVYDLTYKIPQTRKYFRKVIVKYDEKKGIIQIGRSIGKNERGVRVNENILCGYDNKMVLRTIYIIPDEFV